LGSPWHPPLTVAYRLVGHGSGTMLSIAFGRSIGTCSALVRPPDRNARVRDCSPSLTPVVDVRAVLTDSQDPSPL
jgi:hypothetical protein